MASFKNTGLTVDATFYDVLIVHNSIKASPKGVVLSSGESINKVVNQQQIGTRISYRLVIDPKPGHMSDYDALRTLLSDANNPEHEFTFPRISGSVTFNGVASAGEDTFRGIQNGSPIWGGLELEIIPTDPQVTI